MAIVLFVSAIITGLVFRKSKLCTAYILTIMYIFAAFRTYDADYNTYLIGFNNIRNTNLYRYAGYTSFVKIFSNIGLTFEDYNCVFYLIVFAVLLIAIISLTENVNMVLASYMIYSYSLDAVQMKSAIADTLALLSIAIIIRINAKGSRTDRKTKICYLLAVLCMASAVYMHFSTIYYVFAISVYYMIRNRKNIEIRILLISVLMIVLLYSGFLVIVMRYANVLRILGDLDYMGHWAVKSTRFGYLVYGSIILLIVMSCSFNKREMVKDEIHAEISTFLMTAMLVFPFVYLNGQYSRLLRIYMLLMYIVFSKQDRTTKISIKRVFNNLMCMGAIALLFYFDIANNYENVLGALLKYNSLIGTRF